MDNKQERKNLHNSTTLRDENFQPQSPEEPLVWKSDTPGITVEGSR